MVDRAFYMLQQVGCNGSKVNLHLHLNFVADLNEVRTMLLHVLHVVPLHTVTTVLLPRKRIR